tara:strand:+ start:637 stop:1329 length:693 start_codon:yes stop_codon:yes gene_type:complete
MIFTPFAFMNTPSGGGSPTNPVTSNLVFEASFGPGQSYSGTGTTITDLSTFGITGTFNSGTYNSNRYMSFNQLNSNAIDFTGTFSQLGFTTEWTIFAYLKLDSTKSVYTVEKSTTPGRDILSLVGNYDGGAVRPWRGNYHGMPAVSIGTTLASVTFTKDANGVANNYKSYKDGSSVSTISSDFSLGVNTTGVLFNANQDKGDWSCYNFMYYDRALSAAEVTSLHNYVTSY